MTAAVAEKPAATATAASLSATVGREDLLAALRFTLDVVPWSRHSLWCYREARLTAGLGRLLVERYDYERAAGQNIPAPAASGQAVVNARALRDAVCALDRGCQVRLLVVTDGRLQVSGGGVEYLLPLGRLDDWPTPPEVVGGRTLQLGQVGLASLARVPPAAGYDDSLPILTGVRLEIHDGTAEAVATDRYRLAVSRVDVGAVERGFDYEGLIPARAIALACKAFRKSQAVSMLVGGRIGSSPGEGAVVITDGLDRRILARTIDGEFPKWRPLIPETHTRTVTVDIDQLRATTRQASVVAPFGGGMRIALDAGRLAFTAGQNDPQGASMAKTVEATVEGDPALLALNPRFVADALGVFDHGPVVIQMTEPNRPVLFTSPEVPGFTWLQMPIRIPSEQVA